MKQLIKRKEKKQVTISKEDFNKIKSPAILKYINDEAFNAKENYKYEFTNYRDRRDTLINVQNLTKEFGKLDKKKVVLNNINFEIREGENVAFLGTNGAGKTTLVEILAGLNKPTSGTVEYKFAYDKTPLEKLGIQFQDSSYPPGITVKEVIKFIIGVYSCKVSEEELEGLINIFGIDIFYKRRASSLSGGQQQRLNALLAIIHKPKVIFLDEISTGLDISIRTRIKDFIKEYAIENGMTIVLVSHDMPEIEYLADRIIVLDKGTIVASIYKDEIMAKYGDVTNFISNYIK